MSSPGKEWSKEWRSLAHWLKALPKPVGVMACNDDCGQRVMEVCKLTGLTVPDLVGLIGADNDEVVCGLTDPPMSSIAINFERAGYEAALCAGRVDAAIAGRSPEDHGVGFACGGAPLHGFCGGGRAAFDQGIAIHP